MKKILTLALALMMVLSLAACGNKTGPAPSGTSDPGTSQQEQQPSSNPGSSQDEPSAAPEAGTWPDNEWTQKIPKPSAGEIGNSGTMGANNQTFYIAMTWTHEEAATYCDEIVNAGNFDKEAYTYYKDSGTATMSVLLEATSSDGWEVKVSDSEILIVKP